MEFYYKLYKKDVSFVTNIIESFEGVAAVRVPDPKQGLYAILQAIVSPDFISLFEYIIEDLKKEVKIERVKKNIYS